MEVEKSIVMQISVVILTFLLFSDHISGGGAKVSGGGRDCLRGHPPAPVEESQNKGMVNHQHNDKSFVFGQITQKI